MCTKIQKMAAMLSDLDKNELECLKSLVGQEIQTRPAEGCKLLALPAELRNPIYSYVARHEMYGQAPKTRSGLLSANKQIRGEFMGVLYGDKMVLWMEIAVVGQFGDSDFATKPPSWRPVKSRKMLKLLLDEGEGVIICPERTLRQAQDHAASFARCYEQREAQKGTPGYDDCWEWLAEVHGILELELAGEFNLHWFSIKREFLQKHGLEQELSDLSTEDCKQRKQPDKR